MDNDPAKRPPASDPESLDENPDESLVDRDGTARTPRAGVRSGVEPDVAPRVADE